MSVAFTNSHGEKTERLRILAMIMECCASLGEVEALQREGQCRWVAFVSEGQCMPGWITREMRIRERRRSLFTTNVPSAYIADRLSPSVHPQPGATGTSLYERLRKQIASIHQVSEDEVDVFSLQDSPGQLGVDVQYSCRGSSFCSASRLNALLLRRRQQRGGLAKGN
ncbi:hypothetical protein E2C01_072857 [Portunus trituberculatus]|uniref:Uncharacterized protein n=1 Tax=Portunus trituberculatus TaxID=210409 RepID=A0A5B7I3N9_PORTR|nr:hypothetical protein [Portunus trituberculatus]